MNNIFCIFAALKKNYYYGTKEDKKANSQAHHQSKIVFLPSKLKQIMEYTAIIKQTKSGKYIAQCEQLPAALTQGDTIEEAIENLKDAIELVLETETMETPKSFFGDIFY